MKKRIIYSIIFSCVLLFLSQSTLAQFVIPGGPITGIPVFSTGKKVQWIHGLNSDSLYWSSYRTEIVPESRHQGQSINYDSNSSITTTAQTLNGDISGRSILIGHSAGGLVARSIQQLDSGVKGIITLGTPNKGATVIQRLEDGSMDIFVERVLQQLNYVSNDCKQLIRKIERNIAIGIASHLDDDAKSFIALVRAVDNVLYEIIAESDNIKLKVDSIVTEIIDKPLTADMEPGSAYMTGINRSSINVPIINIAGYETDWPVLRIASTLANLDDVLDTLNTSDNGYDAEYVDMILEYQPQIKDGIALLNKYKNHLLVRIFFLRDATKKLIADLGSIMRYIDIGLNADYTDLVGAYHYERRKILVDPPAVGVDPFNPNNDPVLPHDFEEAEHEYRYVTVKVYDKHDGLVSEWSTQIPSDLGNKIWNVTLPGGTVNHMEMCANEHVRRELELILDGGQGYDDAFDYKD